MHTRWKSYFDDENQFDGAVLNVTKIVYEVVELWYKRMFIMLKGWKNEAFPWYRVWWRWNIGNEVCRCHFPITHFIYDGIFCTHISAKKNYVRPIFAAYILSVCHRDMKTIKKSTKKFLAEMSEMLYRWQSILLYNIQSGCYHKTPAHHNWNFHKI